MAQVPSTTSTPPAATTSILRPPLASIGQTDPAPPSVELESTVEGEWSAVDFLDQLHNRFLAHKISINYEKLALVRQAMRGPAHGWYIDLQMRTDFIDSFAYFRSCLLYTSDAADE